MGQNPVRYTHRHNENVVIIGDNLPQEITIDIIYLYKGAQFRAQLIMPMMIF